MSTLNEPADTPAAALLNRTADILQLGGWQRNSFGSTYYPDSPHCLIGAFQLAVGRNIYDEDAQSALVCLATEVGVPANGRTSQLIQWNDLQRDKRKIVRTLRRAAKKCNVTS